MNHESLYILVNVFNRVYLILTFCTSRRTCNSTHKIQKMMRPQQQSDAEKQQQKQQQEEHNKSVLLRVLTREAYERLNNVKLVKPEKAAMIEHYIVQMASKKPIMLEESDILNLLEQPDFNESAKVIIKRRVESDDEWAALEGDEY